MPDTAQLTRAALKILYPSIAIVGIIVISRWKKIDLRSGLGLVWPPLGATIAWLVAYAALILGSNALMHWRGPWDFAPWRAAPMLVNVCRVLGVAILGPIAEELIFRGALYDRIVRTRLDPRLGIAVLAAAWAVLHYSYSGGVISLIFVGGLLLGAARRQTGSVVTPVLMHMLWNLYAIW